MSTWFNLDWRTMFYPDTPLLEIFIRGTLVYLGMFILLRLVLKRESGTVGTSDLLVIVLIADAAQNAMANNYRSITDGLLLVAVILFWSYMLDLLGFYFPVVRKLTDPPALLLIKNGEMLRHNMRKEFITEDELLSLLRKQGIDDLARVSKAFMEGDGQVSVITQDQQIHNESKSKKH